MNRRLAAAAGLASAVAITLSGTIGLATGASAAPSVGVHANSASVVADHEGDVLVQVNVAMPATATVTKVVTTTSVTKAHAKTRR